jgi:predicted nucleotidyltransferase
MAPAVTQSIVGSAVSAGEARDVDVVRSLVTQALKDYPARIFLFGSRATGTARRMSDIDVAVLHDGIVPADVFARIRDLLEDSPVVRKVDLIDLAEVGESFRQRVLLQGVEWTG